MTHRPLRIGLVTDFYPPGIGGIEVQVRGLAEALVSQGHDARVITTSRAGSVADTVPVERLEFHRLLRTQVAMPTRAGYRLLRDRIAAGRFDVIHAHGMFSTLGMGGLIAAGALGVPSVVTHHSLIRFAHLPIARLLYAVASGRATVITAVSEAAAVDARLASGRRDVITIPNGICAAAARRRQPVRSDGQPVHVVSVMRLKLKRRPYHLIWDLRRVAARVSRPDAVRFSIVGGGPERRRVERLASWLGLGGMVTFCGPRTPDEVAAILDEADLFVSPARAEAFGLALLEARAAGLPVVAMHAGGVPDVVAHGRQGLLVQSRREFVDAIVTLVENAALRRQLAAGSRTNLERFSWDVVAARYLDAYRHAITHGRRRPGVAV